jgi:hypothetical protein
MAKTKTTTNESIFSLIFGDDSSSDDDKQRRKLKRNKSSVVACPINRRRGTPRVRTRPIFKEPGSKINDVDETDVKETTAYVKKTTSRRSLPIVEEMRGDLTKMNSHEDHEHIQPRSRASERLKITVGHTSNSFNPRTLKSRIPAESFETSVSNKDGSRNRKGIRTMIMPKVSGSSTYKKDRESKTLVDKGLLVDHPRSRRELNQMRREVHELVSGVVSSSRTQSRKKQSPREREASKLPESRPFKVNKGYDSFEMRKMALMLDKIEQESRDEHFCGSKRGVR